MFPSERLVEVLKGFHLKFPPGPAGQWLIQCLIDQDERVAH